MLLVEIWKYYSKVYEATCTRQRIQRIPSAAIFKQGLDYARTLILILLLFLKLVACCQLLSRSRYWSRIVAYH